MDRKKLMYVGGGVIGFIFVLVIIILIVSAAGGKNLSYGKLENKMLNAAKNYVKDNSSILPTDEGASASIEASTLASNKYMKNLADLRKEDTCTGKVIITKNGDRYLYSPILDCGSNYKTKRLYEVVKEDNPIVFSGDGLYTNGSNLKFKGEYLDNYVLINKSLWRIMQIDGQGYMKLILVDDVKLNSLVWDDRYNIEVDDDDGINDYSKSRLKKSLEELENGDKLFDEEDKVNLAYKEICVGKRSENNKAMNIQEECQTIVNDRMISLPYVIDYVSASVDANCINIDDDSCSNYNYLMASGLTSWTLTGSKEASNKAYTVNKNNQTLVYTSRKKEIRPIVYVSNNALYEDGDGTKANPYIMK